MNMRFSFAKSICICAFLLIAALICYRVFRGNITEKDYLVSPTEFSPHLYQFKFKALSLTQGCFDGEIPGHYFLHPDSNAEDAISNPGISTYLDFILWAGIDFSQNLKQIGTVDEGTKILKRGIEYVTSKAGQGLRCYQTLLAGFFYFYTPNKQKGLYWAEKGAEAGETGSMTILGHAYSNGHGVILDMAEGWKWYTIASALGSLEAQGQILAKTVCDEDGPTKEERKRGKEIARDWMEKHRNLFVSNQ